MNTEGLYQLNDKNEIVPIQDVLEWATSYESDNRTVALTIIRPHPDHPRLDTCILSTVFMGISHSLGSKDPLLFETMLFGGNDDLNQNLEKRYRSYTEARDEHNRIVEEILIHLGIGSDHYQTYYPRESEEDTKALPAVWEEMNNAKRLPDISS